MSNLDKLKEKYETRLDDEAKLIDVVEDINNVKESLDSLIDLIKTRNF